MQKHKEDTRVFVDAPLRNLACLLFLVHPLTGALTEISSNAQVQRPLTQLSDFRPYALLIYLERVTVYGLCDRHRINSRLPYLLVQL